jgi:hypothetical protein
VDGHSTKAQVAQHKGDATGAVTGAGKYLGTGEDKEDRNNIIINGFRSSKETKADAETLGN